VEDESRWTAGRRLLGHRLRDARVRSGLSLQQAAQRSDLSPSYISDVERGRNLPSLIALVAMADAYRTTASGLLDGVYPFGAKTEPKDLPGPPKDARFRDRD
jgi:transcriptional regulator with XRE-family HTH domain